MDKAVDKKAYKRGRGFSRVLCVLCLILFVLCAGFGYLSIDRKFGAVSGLASSWYFIEAKASLESLPPFFPGIDNLSRYIDAGVLMESGDFVKAKEEFLSLGDYRDSSLLVQECDYRNAQTLTEAGELLAAREIFLSLGTYAQAEGWASECEYRQGLKYYEELQSAVTHEDIVTLGKAAIDCFGNKQGHPYADEMLGYTNAFLYAIAEDNFITAAMFSNSGEVEDNAIGDEKNGEEESSDTKNTNTENAGAGNATGESIISAQSDDEYHTLLKQAEDIFLILRDYEESRLYISAITIAIKPAAAAAMELREQLWDFAPARALLLNRMLPEFFYGKWSGGGYGITFDKEYRFYALALNDVAPFVSGSITKTGKNSWKKAYSFNILGKDEIMILRDTREYLLERKPVDADISGGQIIGDTD